MQTFRSMTQFLSTQLVDQFKFKNCSAQQTVITSMIVQLLFWMTVLDWGREVEGFCSVLVAGAAKGDETRLSLHRLLSNTKTTLAEAYSNLGLHSHPELELTELKPKKRNKKRKDGRKHQRQAKIDSDGEYLSMAIVGSSAQPNNV